MANASNAVTKKSFLTALMMNISDKRTLGDHKFVAGLWWDLYGAIDVEMPWMLNSHTMFSMSRLKLFKDDFNALYEKTYAEAVAAVEQLSKEPEFTEAFMDAMVDIGLYEKKWRFIDPDSDEFFDIFGQRGDDDWDWYVEQYKKSVSAISKYGMTNSGYEIVHPNPEMVEAYERDRGSIPHPDTGNNDYDPALVMVERCTRTKKEYERGLMVSVTSSEIATELLSIVGSDILLVAANNVRQRKLASLTV